MKNIDFQQAVLQYDMDLERLMLDYKREYTDAEREKIFRYCRNLSRLYIPTTDDSDQVIKEDVIRPFFLRSLKVFDNSIISDYFERVTSKVKIVKYSSIEAGFASLDYSAPINGKRNFKIEFPKQKKYTFTDQFSYAHEVGHIPELDLARRSYLEYNEVLPIFMEYICELRKHKDDKDDALAYFLMERLKFAIDDCHSIMKIFKRLDHPKEVIRLYHAQQFVDTYKYIESLDFVLQLIDRMNEDKTEVGKEIQKVLFGKSFIEVADDLDINTEGCQKLLGESKRLSKRL